MTESATNPSATSQRPSSWLQWIAQSDPLERLGHVDPLERLGRVSWRGPLGAARTSALTLAVVLVILIGLGASVAAVGGVAAGVNALGGGPANPSPVTGSPTAVVESMQIVSDGSGATADWPRFTNSHWTVHRGQTVEIRIRNFDDGTAPLTGAQAMFHDVQGTIGGTEAVNGNVVGSVNDINISHTFTVVGLDLNLPIPVAPTGGSVSVVARFVATKTGTFVWQCYAPCGSGANSMGGAMSTAKWMTGTVTVVA